MPSAARRNRAKIDSKASGASGAGRRERQGAFVAPDPFLSVSERLRADEPKRTRKAYKLELPAAYRFLFRPARYKVAYSGRGAGKSWGVADALLTVALQRKIRVLCARQFQASIADSVHRLLKDRISARGLDDFFTVTQTGIVSRTGSEFIFKGLKLNAAEIKSLEGVDICWVEEAQHVNRESWDLLIPTIRKEGSEIWITFNPGAVDSETWQRFVAEPPENAVVVKTSWRDNPFFPATLDEERRHAQRVMDPEDYANIWEGEPLTHAKSQIFAGRYQVAEFESPATGVRLYYGADWGFADDPTTLVRAFERDGCLYVDHEAWAQGCEIERLPALFRLVPDAQRWPIRADNSRPELIRFMRRMGFIVKPCRKWPGSVEEGVTFLRSGFERLVVHPRCTHVADELRLYSYKTDKTTGDVLPAIVDKNNHCVDALRYAIEPVIRGRARKDRR